MTTSTSMLDEFDVDGRVKRPSVIERVTQVMDAFLVGGEWLTLQDVTSFTGLPRSTTFRILSQLVEQQWLAHDSHGYRLGERSRWLGAAQRGDCADVRAAAAGHISNLHLTTGAVVHLVVREGAQVVYLDKIGGFVARSVPSEVGRRVPAGNTAGGKVLLAAMSPERVDDILCLDQGDSGAVSLPRLHRDLDRIRRRHSVAYESARDCPLGIGAVAAAVIGSSGPVAAISVAGRGSLSLDAIAPLVVAAARRISLALARDRSRMRRRTGDSCGAQDAVAGSSW